MPGPVIIGGGPAGATAAILLARAGRAVTLIERNAGPTDKVCGDFLSAEAIEAIAALGVDIAALAPSQITNVRLVHGKRSATARLPFPALGLTRRALDEALLRQAELSGATILRGCSVRGINRTTGLCGSIAARERRSRPTRCFLPRASMICAVRRGPRAALAWSA